MESSLFSLIVMGIRVGVKTFLPKLYTAEKLLKTVAAALREE